MKENTHSLIYLAQCDTTTGFLSHNAEILNLCKSRPKEQPLLIESSSLHILKTLVRVPKGHKNRIRKAKYTTFIYPNKKAIRLVREGLHSHFLEQFKTLYSTSANPTKEDFNEIWARQKCDVIVLDKRGFSQKSPSKIYTINHHTIKRKR
ncbi:Sua5 YciO YrdC YwlC family protein [Helicobacter sp. MIT 21-1697]|uniref:Sua5 YciO YrdC YwlC family protein n=1 Tax=Helicobacter sp. MIT 21-1697 TaxID=2993733 RepID=UPI00224B8473|nr:Sua5 YciO YrdC YwlC family protein [Helicobacter sp. MIT 21-1697]MCX2716748.1 Sua5 YciO YrdC YwlC family protein [Helicobacter sp. MIT 21-1697]